MYFVNMHVFLIQCMFAFYVYAVYNFSGMMVVKLIPQAFKIIKHQQYFFFFHHVITDVFVLLFNTQRVYLYKRHPACLSKHTVIALNVP